MSNEINYPYKRTPPRSYNHLKDCGHYFIKSSTNVDKIIAEANYYENLPHHLEKFHPKYLGKTSEGFYENGYMIYKVSQPDLSLLFTKIVNKDNTMIEIYALLKNYLDSVPKKQVTINQFQNHLHSEILQRDLDRIEELSAQAIFDSVNELYEVKGFKSIHNFQKELHSKINSVVQTLSHFSTWFSHGDLCLSNIIIDNDKLYLIDPRGIKADSDKYLNPYYDIAKLSQCFLGNYDFYNHEISINPTYPELKGKFESFVSELGLNLQLVRLIESSHFLAMLPLHCNSPQKVLKFALQSIISYKEACQKP